MLHGWLIQTDLVIKTWLVNPQAEDLNNNITILKTHLKNGAPSSHRAVVNHVRSRVALMRSGSRAPDARLQTQVGGAEPGSGDSARVSAAGCWPRGTSGADGTQIWGALKLPVGLRVAGGWKVQKSWRLD